jgi:hypothetical protein
MGKENRTDRATKEGCSWITVQTIATTTNKNNIPLLFHHPISHTQLSLNSQSSGYSRHRTQLFLILSKAILPPYLQLFTLITYTLSRNHQNLTRQRKKWWSFKFKPERLLNTKLQNDLVRKGLKKEAGIAF